MPSRKFEFSATYKNECDECIDDFLDNQREKTNKNVSLLNTINSQPKLVPIAGGDDLREKLNVKNNQISSFLPSIY